MTSVVFSPRVDAIAIASSARFAASAYNTLGLALRPTSPPILVRR